MVFVWDLINLMFPNAGFEKQKISNALFSWKLLKAKRRPAIDPEILEIKLKKYYRHEYKENMTLYEFVEKKFGQKGIKMLDELI